MTYIRKIKHLANFIVPFRQSLFYIKILCFNKEREIKTPFYI